MKLKWQKEMKWLLLAALAFLVSCAGCKMQNASVVLPSQVEIASDDEGSIFLVQLTNCTDKAVAFDDFYIGIVFQYGLYKMATTGILLETVFYDEDIMYEPYSKRCSLGPGSSISLAFNRPQMQIKGVSVGDQVLWSIDMSIPLYISSVREYKRIQWNGPAKILSRDEALIKCAAIHECRED